MNRHIAERVFRVLHLAHLGKKMMIAIIRPTVVRVTALETNTSRT